MDIRKFFTASSGHNTRKQPVNNGEAEKPTKAKSSKSKREDEAKKSKSSKRRRVAYISDSSDADDDDVEFVKETATPTKKLKTAEGAAAGVRSSPRTVKSKTPSKQEEKKKEKRSASDFFGSKKVTTGSKEAPKTISGKLSADATSKTKNSKDSSSNKKKSVVNTKDEIIVLDTDQEAWSDDESFAQLVDDKKTEEHDNQDFNKTLEKTKGKSPSKNKESPAKAANGKQDTKSTPSKQKSSDNSASPVTSIKEKKNKTATPKSKDKYKPLPLSEEKPKKEEQRGSETPRTKARKLREATPDQTEITPSKKPRAETPNKKSSSQTSTRSGTRSATPSKESKTEEKADKIKNEKTTGKSEKRNSSVSPIPSKAVTAKAEKAAAKPKKPSNDAALKKAATKEATPVKSQTVSPRKSPVKPVSIKGKTFVLTGQLANMERDDAKELVIKHGGRVVSALSGKVNYMVAGEEAGLSKLAKAEKMAGLKIITEAEFYSLLGLSEDGSAPSAGGDEDGFSDDDEQSFMEVDEPTANSKPETKSVMPKRAPISSEPSSSNLPSLVPTVPRDGTENLLWVEKYKPGNLNKIIGQNGDKSNAKKLLTWIKNWHRHRKLGTKPVSSFGGFRGGGGDGAGFRAALLSGPPGIGKTTTATLVCKEAAFTYFETNASDSRSKKILQETIGGAIGNTTLMDFVSKGNAKPSSTENKKHCIIMDEVDGMAGNEDRGGMQELIQLIKSSHIPIICICNDRQSQKIRSLANHCFDLRFQRPRVEQIKSAMRTVCMREGVNIDGSSLDNVIEASNHDVRQILHNLSVWSATNANLDQSQVKKDSGNAKKDFKIDLFTACRMAFSESETKKMSLIDRSDLFFYDYSMHPLFIQENYIHASPHGSGSELDKLKRMARASNCISMGDVISKSIRMERWGLLPMQAMFSSVLPCASVMGHLSRQIEFPKWLGKFSSTNKNFRQNKEVAMHMGLSITGSAQHMLLDYLPMLRDRLTTPMIEDQNEGVGEVIGLMERYDLTKEDYDSVLELTQWPGHKDPRTQIESKTKAAMTRQYNKSSHKHHYSQAVAPVKKRKAAAAVSADVELEEEGAAGESDVDSDEEVVKALKVQPKKTAAKASAKGSAKPKAGAKAEKKPRAPAKKKK